MVLNKLANRIGITVVILTLSCVLLSCSDYDRCVRNADELDIRWESCKNPIVAKKAAVAIDKIRNAKSTNAEKKLDKILDNKPNHGQCKTDMAILAADLRRQLNECISRSSETCNCQPCKCDNDEDWRNSK